MSIIRNFPYHPINSCPGRRVLHSYLLLFLHSSTASAPSLDYEDVASRALNTYILGEFVAPQWALGDVIRWTPARPVEDKGLTSLKGIGLYKVHGTVVEAVMGGVFHQFVRILSPCIHTLRHHRYIMNLTNIFLFLGRLGRTWVIPHTAAPPHPATGAIGRIARLVP